MFGSPSTRSSRYSRFRTSSYVRSLAGFLLIDARLTILPTKDLYSTLNFWTSLVLTQVASIGPKFLWKYVQASYLPHDSDIIREQEVLQTTKASSLDLEAQSKHEDHPLVRSPLPANARAGDRRDRTLSNESSGVGSPYDERQMPFSAASEGGHRSLGPPASEGGIPTINIQGTTPRASVASRGSEFGYDEGEYGDRDARWDYSSVPSQTAIDLHGVSPLQDLDQAARYAQSRDGSVASWTTANEARDRGYAL
jgi:hypothetical protein